ncbi:penicillin-binding protein [Streptomyces piniterrae]|uniref:Penicillin-binding protein n=1 Tax=Streptomyces piniterrae TaxID=2571125 RepID=A0A4U0N9R7_9ACTN|nr:transglycosylase domain-containing protein [Streptomyces piniterrae]TJZ50202.1 penicillin-binding protein [Streptomyces piniterrae]
MSEHRRKPPQPQGGGRAAARRAAQQPTGRRAVRGSAAGPAPGSEPYGQERPYGGRAEARRAAQRGSRRRTPDDAAMAAGGGRGGRRGGGRGGGGGHGPEGGPGRGSGRPPKKRFIDYPRFNRTGWRRFVPSWKQVTGLTVTFMGLIVGAAGVALALVHVPSESDAAKQQNNVYLWADGSVMARDGQTNRQNVKIAEIPKAMQWAAMAAENASFKTDSGVDPMGIARALFNMARGGDTQGGSTITQQYVKNAMLTQEQTLDRKVKELFISIKVDSKMSKDEILQGYLNTSYYGRGAYGIQAAAQAYYGKNAFELNPAESAMLATVLKGADLYDPAGGSGPHSSKAENTKRAQARWSWILDREVEVGFMDKSVRDKYRKFPTPDQPKAVASKTGQIGYLMDTAKKYVLKHSTIGEALFDKGGYTIQTTFDRRKVNKLADAVRKVDKRYINPKERAKDKYVQFGAASVVPGDGKIVALYGGEGYDKGHFSNNADTFGVPVGSTWKPFVLAAAMKYGKADNPGVAVSPESRYNGNDHLKVKDANGDYVLKRDNSPFFQENESAHRWGYISLVKAMEQSVNTPFVQLGMDVGMTKVRDMAHAAGISDESFDKNLNPSFALGTSTPSAIRMADAYATFAASGKKYEPYSVTKVTREGVDEPGFEKPHEETAMDAEIANNVTKVLQNVIKNGTAKDARRVGIPAAGKTGTTDENKSAWFVGYTPKLSTSVTMFREDPKNPRQLSMNGVGGFDSIHGGALPTEVWTEYMLQANIGSAQFPAATDIGQRLDEEGMPTPTPTPTPSQEPSETPSETPSESAPPSGSPSPGPTETCSTWDVKCQETGGTTTGGDTGGTTGGETSPTPDPGGPGGGNGNGNGGGLFGGPSGS